MVYATGMKRFQMLLDDHLDDALRREARRRRTSRAELLRRYARDALRALPPLTADPIGAMVGSDDFDPADIEETVYQ